MPPNNAPKLYFKSYNVLRTGGGIFLSVVFLMIREEEFFAESYDLTLYFPFGSVIITT